MTGLWHDAAAAVAALAVVVGLAIAVGRLARVTGMARRLRPASGRLVLSDRLRLDGRRSVVLIACDGREVLLLIGGPADVVIGWLPARTPA